MTILADVYKLTASVSAESDYLFPLETPKKVILSINFDQIPTDTNNVTVFWNFDDPWSSSNELVTNDAINSNVEHTFNNAGVYNVTNISNINGTQYHINKMITVPPTSGNEYGVALVPPPAIYDNAVTGIHIKTYDKFADVKYKLDLNDDFISVPSSGITIDQTKTIFYQVTFSDASTSPLNVSGDGLYVILIYESYADIVYTTSGTLIDTTSTSAFNVYFDNYSTNIVHYTINSSPYTYSTPFNLNGIDNQVTTYDIEWYMSTSVSAFPDLENPHVVDGYYNYAPSSVQLVVDKVSPSVSSSVSSGTLSNNLQLQLVPNVDWTKLQNETFNYSITGNSMTVSGVYSNAVSSINFNSLLGITPLGNDVLYPVTLQTNITDIFSRNNNQNFTYNIDVDPPTLTLQHTLTPYTQNTSYTFTLSADDITGISAYKYKLNNGAWVDYVSNNLIENITVSGFAAESLPNVLEFKAYDGAGNESVPVTASFIVDKTSPDVSVSPSGSPYTTNTTSGINLTISVTDIEDYTKIKGYYALNSVATTASTVMTFNSNKEATFTVSGSEGLNNVNMLIIDSSTSATSGGNITSYGNQTYLTAQYQLDTTGPVITFDKTNNQTINITVDPDAVSTPTEYDLTGRVLITVVDSTLNNTVYVYEYDRSVSGSYPSEFNASTSASFMPYTLTTVSTTGTYSYPLYTLQPNLIVGAIDNAGNISSTSLTGITVNLSFDANSYSIPDISYKY